VERIGVDRARERALAADLRVFLLLDEADEPALSPGLEDVVVVGRGDLYHGSQIAVSGKTGAGIDALVTTVSSRLAARAVVSSTVIRARQRQSISRALTCITAARDEADQGEARVEYASEELHRAILELDALVGRVDVEHVLDEIFASFCLGK
jgi:tRNA modification GTPase